MIVAIEGPDGCGKTTLFEALRGRVDAVFMPSMGMHPELLPHTHSLNVRTEELWRLMYDPSKLYICDRHLSVSGPVYSRVFSGADLDFSYWRSEVLLVYLRASLIELMARFDDDTTPKSALAALLGEYGKEVEKFPSRLVLDASASSDSNATEVLQCLSTRIPGLTVNL